MKVTPYLKSLLPDTLIAFYQHQKLDQLEYVLILKHINSEILFNISKELTQQYLEFKILTLDELKNCLDVFPIEFLDIKTQRELIIGTDIIKSIRASKKYLRHECEFYLRSGLIKLREAYLSMPDHPGLLISDSYPTLLQVLRYLAPILGTKWESNNTKTSLSKLEKKLQLDLKGLIIIDDNLQNLNFLDDYFFSYHNTFTKIVNFVDAID